jgi:hypothetical protein
MKVKASLQAKKKPKTSKKASSQWKSVAASEKKVENGIPQVSKNSNAETACRSSRARGED